MTFFLYFGTRSYIKTPSQISIISNSNIWVHCHLMDTSKLRPSKIVKSYARFASDTLFLIFGNFKYSSTMKSAKSYTNLWRSSLKYWMIKKCLMMKVSQASRLSPISCEKYAIIKPRSRPSQKKRWYLCWKMNSLHSILDKLGPMSQNNHLSILRHIVELISSNRSEKSKKRHFSTIIKRRYTVA